MASSSLSPQSVYDVLINLRGVDTRDNIIRHVYAGLCRNSIRPFIGDKDLSSGEEVWPALSRAIEASKISVIIFSEEFPYSTWCLDDLVEILECKRKNGQIVIPVFYHVYLPDVQNQMGCIGDAFVKHERRFPTHQEVVQWWREASTDAIQFTITSRESGILPELLDAIQGKIPGFVQLHKPKCAFVPSMASSAKKPRHLAIQLNIPKLVSCPSLFHTAAASYGQEIGGLHQLEKLQVLGQGNGGTVFKVRHKHTLALYALKVIRCDRGTPHLQELNILRQTNSPYIVKCHQIFTKPFGEVSILMEYVDAGSLESYVKSHGRLSEDLIVTFSRQVLKGLVYMRSKKIVHRDIKPANLLINQKMEIKIADFGISKIIQQCLERCSTPVGTCAYMSPERLDTEKYGSCYDGFAADIWSFGVTMMELYMGYYPFLEEGQTPDFSNLMLAICFGEPPSLLECSSEKFRDFIRCCLQKDDPSKRWTASQLLSHPFLVDA